MRTFTSDDFISVHRNFNIILAYKPQILNSICQDEHYHYISLYIIYKQGMPNFDILVSLDYSFNEF